MADWNINCASRNRYFIKEGNVNKMGVVNLARVDERLIHGQVMVTLSQKSGVNSIFVVDEVVAKDKFMRDLYKMQEAVQDKKQLSLHQRKLNSIGMNINLKNTIVF